MKRLVLTLLILLTITGCAFASDVTIDELLAQLEGKSPETITQEREQRMSVDEAKKEIEAVKKNLRFRTDKMENVTWTRTKISTGKPYFDMYCGERNGKIWLRVKLEPSANTKQPMIMNTVLLNIDGHNTGFTVKASDRKTSSEVRSSRGTFGGIDVNRWFYEEVDMSVITPELETLLRQAADGKTVMVRMRGNYSEDFMLSKQARAAFDAMLRYYRARQVLLGSI